MFDLLIQNGLVHNGTGEEPFPANIAIRKDRIAEIGELPNATARTIVDACGCCVTPGFIDTHSHSDSYLLIEPSAPSKITQGITTEVVGNCGASAAPLYPPYRMPSDWADKKYPASWKTIAEYRALLEQAKPALNTVILVGHNTLRAGVAGYENRPLTAQEQKLMESRLRQAMEEGARGISTGLLYSPGIFATREEIISLSKVAAKANGIYTTHMRSEGAALLEAMEETLSIGREAEIRIQISHFKTSGHSNWHKITQALEKIHAAHQEGLSVAADRYPYTFGCTDLDVILPDWAQEGGREKVLHRLRDPKIHKELHQALSASREPADWGGITIGSTSHPETFGFRGRTLPEVAKDLELDAPEAALWLMEKDELRTSAFFAGMSEDNMLTILSEPYVMVGSDASIRSLTGPLSEDFPHPRAYGTFPRFLRMVLDGRLLNLPEAIRKITSLPAQQFRLHNRGVLKEGAMADIVVFDPGTIKDNATCARPHRLSTGIQHVIVNGALTLKDGHITSHRAGRVL